MRELEISCGSSCTEKHWQRKTVTFDELCEKLKTTVRTSETAEEYQKLKKEEKNRAKDRGGFVGGGLSGGRRTRNSVAFRSMLTLDADHAEKDFISRYTENCSVASCLYTTHGHAPQSPRLRVIVPLKRDVTPDEYAAIARFFAADWGIDQFDECSFRPHQLMYWPTSPSDGEYIFRRVEGEWLDPDEVLSQHPDWRDCRFLPSGSREKEAGNVSREKLGDPLEKEGVVGLFCRTYYPIQAAIDAFLSDVYEPAPAVPGRYQYREAESAAGVMFFDGRFAYSFHASDPACGMSLNAFDLVRIHKFPNVDEKKSFRRMCDFAMAQEAVRLQAASERESALEQEVICEDWRSHLKYIPHSDQLEDSVANLVLILNNDPDFANFACNELAGRVQVTGPVPWSRPSGNKFWRDADTAQLKARIDVKYRCFSTRNHEVAFTKVMDDRHFNPIRDYLDALPPWDGKKRVETLLVDCLEAEDCEYTRAVTRKTLAAAVARVLCPGIKFDSVLVLDGAQGIGKSTLFKDLVGEEYYSETLSLTDMNDKSGAEKLQGLWIVEIAELAGMKKADIEKVKAFLSTSDDSYRPSYHREVESHPRQCIIIASVNGERGYLRDSTGNRRFWVVKLKRTAPKKEWNLAQERDQIWAEAKELWMNGEKLYLEGDLIKEAEKAQKAAMEEDERKGIVEEYLNTPLPADWDKMDLYRRREFLADPEGVTQPKGVCRRNTVSNMEIWCECFGLSAQDMRHNDSLTLSALMMQIPGWEKTDKVLRTIYGKQRLYERLLPSPVSESVAGG